MLYDNIDRVSYKYKNKPISTSYAQSYFSIKMWKIISPTTSDWFKYTKSCTKNHAAVDTRCFGHRYTELQNTNLGLFKSNLK